VVSEEIRWVDVLPLSRMPAALPRPSVLPEKGPYGADFYLYGTRKWRALLMRKLIMVKRKQVVICFPPQGTYGWFTCARYASSRWFPSYCNKHSFYRADLIEKCYSAFDRKIVADIDYGYVSGIFYVQNAQQR
jgi:hypothetical protein